MQPLTQCNVRSTARQFTLTQVIGKGQSGEVYRAQAVGGVDVAIKVIPVPCPEVVRREERSLHLIKTLRHVFLLPIHGFWEDNGQLYVVMELADGSLRDWYGRSGRGGVSGPKGLELQRYVSEAAEALDYLHGHGVIHRDVKPDNILLVGHHVKVGDCGLARLGQINWVRRATCAGTPGFMAPEAWRGEPCFATDQYSLAMTYTELRLGRLPFTGNNFAEMMLAHENDEPNLDPIGDEERPVLLKALAKRPEDRYLSCTAFMHALKLAAPMDNPCLATGSRGSVTTILPPTRQTET